MDPKTLLEYFSNRNAYMKNLRMQCSKQTFLLEKHNLLLKNFQQNFKLLAGPWGTWIWSKVGAGSV